MRVMLASRRMRSRLTEKLSAHGQTDARWTTLYWLADSPQGVIQNELAERIGVSGPSLVKLLDTLESHGLVQRRSAPGDRRANLVMMLPEGLRVLGELEQIAAELRDELFRDIPEAELRAALAVLDRVAERAAEETGGTPPVRR